MSAKAKARAMLHVVVVGNPAAVKATIEMLASVLSGHAKEHALSIEENRCTIEPVARKRKADADERVSSTMPTRNVP